MFISLSRLMHTDPCLAHLLTILVLSTLKMYRMIQPIPEWDGHAATHPQPITATFPEYPFCSGIPSNYSCRKARAGDSRGISLCYTTSLTRCGVEQFGSSSGS